MGHMPEPDVSSESCKRTAGTAVDVGARPLSRWSCRALKSKPATLGEPSAPKTQPGVPGPVRRLTDSGRTSGVPSKLQQQQAPQVRAHGARVRVPAILCHTQAACHLEMLRRRAGIVVRP